MVWREQSRHRLHILHQAIEQATADFARKYAKRTTIRLADERSEKVLGAFSPGPMEPHPARAGWIRNRRLRIGGNPTVAFWGRTGMTLAGLIVIGLHNRSVVVELFDARPPAGHQMQGMIAPLGIDVAARYTQGIGFRDLLILSSDPKLLDHLQHDYGLGPIEMFEKSYACRVAFDRLCI